MRTPHRSALVCALVGFTTVLAPAATAHADEGAPAAHAAACTHVDGTATSGATLGSNPVKYEYGNSPYAGARYKSCLDVVSIYYGGYTSGVDYYNIRYDNGDQGQFSAATPNMVFSFEPNGGVNRYVFAIEACKKGGVFQKSACTRWSPTVSLTFTR